MVRIQVPTCRFAHMQRSSEETRVFSGAVVMQPRNDGTTAQQVGSRLFVEWQLRTTLEIVGSKADTR